MDVMAANGLLRSVIEASQILGVNQDKIPVWKAMQEKMPSYMLNENGEIREWMWKDLQDNGKRQPEDYHWSYNHQTTEES